MSNITKEEVVKRMAQILVDLNISNYRHMCVDNGVEKTLDEFHSYGITTNQVENMLVMFLPDIVTEVTNQQTQITVI